MFKRSLLALAVLLAARLVAADQAEVITKEVAAKADKILDYGTEVRFYCAPCGDKTYRREVVADKDTQDATTPGQVTLFVNGNPADLAYLYVEKDGKWMNVGKLAGAKVDSVPDVLPAEVPAGMKDFDRVKFVGLVDGHIAISAELSKFSGEMNGTYFYSHVGTALNLTGTIDQLGAFTLNETDSDSNKTGAFSGKLTDGGAKAEGTWVSADSSKKLAFALKRVALHGEENGSIVSGSQGTETHLDFPIFIAGYGAAYAAVNEALQTTIRGRFTEYASQFAATAAELGLDDPTPSGGDGDLGQTISVGDSMLFLAREDVVSVLFNVSLYQGGAHGMTMSLPVNLRVSKSGDGYKTKPITIGDLLKPGAESLKALGDFLLEELKKKNASLVTNGEIKAFKVEDMDAFTLSPKGIQVYFDPYAVASYAEGPFEVFVPFSALPDAFSAEALKGIAEASAPAAAPAAAAAATTAK